jgi:hypothetical protein
MGLARADREAMPLNSFLAAWGNHPFGSNPAYKTRSISVKVVAVGPLASSSSCTPVWGGENTASGLTVLGGISVERVGCGPG